MNIRRKAQRNILIMMVNSGLEQGIFGLGVGETYKYDESNSNGLKYGYYYFEFRGLRFKVRTILDDEEIGLTCCIPKKISIDEIHPSVIMRHKDARVLAGAWLERERGRYLCCISEFVCQRNLLRNLAEPKLDMAESGFHIRGLED